MHGVSILELVTTLVLPSLQYAAAQPIIFSGDQDGSSGVVALLQSMACSGMMVDDRVKQSPDAA